MDCFENCVPILENLENNSKCYLVYWNKYLFDNCGKWSGNRDVDISRVDEMVEFYEKGGYFPPLIHVAFDCKNEPFKYSCYDGNHRRECFNRLFDKGIKVKCFVNVLYNAKIKQIYREFENLNKAIQVPALYFDTSFENDETENNIYKIRQEITDLVKKYVTKYPSFVKSSSKNQVPNFNRDKFSDDIFEVYNSFNGEKSIDDIEEILELLNRYYRKNQLCTDHSKFSSKVIEK